MLAAWSRRNDPLGVVGCFPGSDDYHKHRRQRYALADHGGEQAVLVRPRLCVVLLLEKIMNAPKAFTEAANRGKTSEKEVAKYLRAWDDRHQDTAPAVARR